MASLYELNSKLAVYEMEFDEDMWDIETGGYDNLEFEDSFTLISPSEFQKIWDSTPREHKPKQR